MTELLVSAFVAGLAGSTHCVGMCGSFASVCARSRSGSIAWHAGRLSMYASLGALSGWAGSLLNGPAWLPLLVSAGLLIWFAGALAGLLPQPRLPAGTMRRTGQQLIQRSDGLSRYMFGMMTGLLPCGLLYAALSLAVAAGSPLRGATVMVVFGSATVPALALLAGVLHRLLARGLWVRRVAALIIVLAGLWSLGMRAQRATHVHHSTNAVPANISGARASGS